MTGAPPVAHREMTSWCGQPVISDANCAAHHIAYASAMRAPKDSAKSLKWLRSRPSWADVDQTTQLPRVAQGVVGSTSRGPES